MRRVIALLLWITACSDSGAGGAHDGGGVDASDGGAARDASEPGTGGQTGSVTGVDAGAGPGSDPLTTPIDRWTFLSIEGARCADGSATGVGVNRADGSEDLLILLQGGGACWDYETCFVLGSAVNVESGYDAAHFAADEAMLQPPEGRDPNNPLSLATQVFVPYCTGDLHGGNAVRDYTLGQDTRTVHHVGAHNVDLMLARLRTGLSAAPPRVWVMGSSAGGYGATLNLQAVERAFPDAEVHMLADSAPLLTPPGGRWAQWQAAWDLRFPAGCADCGERFGAVVDAIATDDRHGRIGLLAYEQDATIGAFFDFDGPAELQALDALLQQSYGHDDTRYFVAAGTDHVMIGRPQSRSAQTDVALSDWLVTWILGLPVWQSAR